MDPLRNRRRRQVPGDSLLCAGMVSYGGAYTAEYRAHYVPGGATCTSGVGINVVPLEFL